MKTVQVDDIISEKVKDKLRDCIIDLYTEGLQRGYEQITSKELEKLRGTLKDIRFEVKHEIEKLRDENARLNLKSDGYMTYEIAAMSGQIAGMLNTLEIIEKYLTGVDK